VELNPNFEYFTPCGSRYHLFSMSTYHEFLTLYRVDDELFSVFWDRWMRCGHVECYFFLRLFDHVYMKFLYYILVLSPMNEMFQDRIRSFSWKSRVEFWSVWGREKYNVFGIHSLHECLLPPPILYTYGFWFDGSFTGLDDAKYFLLVIRWY
jgi:hypothetical protein